MFLHFSSTDILPVTDAAPTGLNLQVYTLGVDFSEIAETFEDLESTQSNLEKTSILAELFEDSGDELPEVVLLATGEPFPEWKNMDLGVSSKTLVKIISKATGRGEDEIEEVWKNEGDLGLAAEQMVEKKTQQRLMTAELTVERVVDRLQKVAEMEAEGASQSVNQDKKQKELAELISSADAKEARYLARIIINNLRLGVAEGTIRDALAEAFFDGEHAEDIQKAYDFTNDFSEVAKACREGIEEVRSLELRLFQPINSMLAKKVETIEEGFEEVGKPAAIDYKYDGMRCISGYTPIYVENKGIVSVRDVEVGDKVLTHKGNFREVKAKNRRTIDKDERVFEFSTYLGNDFKITEGHEVLTEEGWVNVENLDEKENRVVFPVPEMEVTKKVPQALEFKRKGGYHKRIEIEEEEDFWKFVGFWVGDGYSNRANGNQRIGLVFNEEEEQLFEKYSSFLAGLLEVPEEEFSTHIHNEAKTLYWTDPPLLNWLSQNFRKQDQSGWKDKKIPKWFWNLEKESFEKFLEGWTDADGQRDEKGRRKNITTKERAMATNAQLIAAKHGISCGIRKLRIEDETYYRLMFTVSDRNAAIEDGKMKLRILKKDELSRSSPREVDPRQKVYNLQVEGDESYCTTTVALHNCQIHVKEGEVKAFTRRLEDVTEQFPDVVESVEENIESDNCIIDTEIVGYDPETGGMIPFQKLSKRIKRKYDIQKLKSEIPVVVRPFDLIYLDEPILEESYSERWSKLKDIVEEEEKEMKMVDHAETEEPEKVMEMQQQSLSEGHEGIMMKNLEAEYKPGNRVGYMVKLKPTMETLDLAIIAAKWSEGRRSDWLGRLFLGCYDEEKDEYREVGKMATGLTDEQFQEITEKLKPLITKEEGRKVEVRPEVIVEVEYEEIQESPTYSSGYALRFPRMKQFRDDKEEADSLEKVENLYKDQEN
jgi:ATP-dependent DNA ligase